MNKCILDTNVWIDLGRRRVSFDDLVAAQRQAEWEYLLAPPVLIELFRGLIRGEGQHFNSNKYIIQCANSLACEILPLPIPFMWKALWNVSGGDSAVRPGTMWN